LYRDGAWFRPIIINETRLLMSGEVYLVLHSLLQQFSAKGFFYRNRKAGWVPAFIPESSTDYFGG
jgi:hypothetical protein